MIAWRHSSAQQAGEGGVACHQGLFVGPVQALDPVFGTSRCAAIAEPLRENEA